MLSIVLPFLLLFAPMQPLVIPGERLTYEVSSARFGGLGHARFTVTELASGVLRITFDFDAKVLFFKASDHTVSELDPKTLRTLRYTKHERSPVGRRTEDVRIDYETSTWTDGGQIQTLASREPLDELSFIYLIRGLDLAPGQELVLRRHFDYARNPVRIQAADNDASVIEMHVPDARQKNGVSVLRFHLDANNGRVPLRIESTMPVVGKVLMKLVDIR